MINDLSLFSLSSRSPSYIFGELSLDQHGGPDMYDYSVLGFRIPPPFLALLHEFLQGQVSPTVPRRTQLQIPCAVKIIYCINIVFFAQHFR